MKLKPGSTVGIVALSGPCERAKVEAAVKYFESKGFNVKLSKNIFDKKAYLAGCDLDKINELHSFFEDKDIDLIINARGGYGAIRLLDRIDYRIVKRNPKYFCGYSDTTALLLMIYKNTGLVTYHSPMACTDFVEVNEFTESKFFKAINSEELIFSGNKSYKCGSANGVIWGGNLATVVSLCGLDFIPDDDFIFFTEDINEPVYKIDKMFQQLFNIDKFKRNCKAIVLGEFMGVDDNILLESYLETLPLPTVAGFKISHSDEKITIPIGAKALLYNEEHNIPVLKINNKL